MATPRGQSRPASVQRELTAYVVACVGHIAVFLLALKLAPTAPVLPPATEPAAERFFDLELLPVPSAARRSVLPSSSGGEPAAGVGTPRREPPGAPRSEGEAPSPAPGEATAPSVPTAPPRPGAADEYGPTEADPILALPPGAGGLPIWSVPGAVSGPGAPAPAPTTAPQRKVDRDVATQVLQGTLGGMDRDKGLEASVGGVTARAVEDAARRISLPHDCHASFEVRVGDKGEVLGVRALSSTAGDAPLWDRVARGAQAALASRRLVMSSRARRGATVIVRLESRYTYPSGSADPQMSDAGSNKSDYLHTTYTVTIPGEKPLPAGTPQPIGQRSRFTKELPTGIAPVEMKPLLPDR